MDVSVASGGIGSSKGELRELLKLFLMFSGFSEQSNEERNQNMSLGLFLGPQNLLRNYFGTCWLGFLFMFLI